MHDHIITGYDGSKVLDGLEVAVFGSVAETVVSHAPCPVAVIREDLKV